MTSIKYIGENKVEITNQLSNCIKHLDKVVSYLSSKTIPSDLSELNSVITEVTAISRVVNTNKEKFTKACQLLNDKESSLVSSISALDYFNINQFTYSQGKIGLVSIFGSGADLSFMSSYYNEEKWSSYYGNTLNSLNSEKEKLNEMINGKLTREEYNKLKKKYPNLQFDYNPITGVARLLTPEEVLKLKNDAESHGSINLTDINKYRSEYEKWFKDSYGYSYEQYKTKVTNIENDILQFESLKYSLDQSIKLKDYDNIKNTSSYKDYNQNYYRNHHGVSVDEEIKKYSNIRVLDDTGLGTDDYENKSLRYYMNYMTEDQKKMYCYLYTTKGSDEANKYLKALEDDLNKVKGLATADKLLEKIALRDEKGNIVTNKVIDNNGNVVDQVVIDSKFLSGNYFDTTMQGLGIGIKNFGEGLGNIFNNEGTISDNQYAQMYIMNYLNNAKEKGQSVDALISDFEISMSIGNMLPSIAASTVVGILCPPAAFEATILSGTIFETTLTAGTITGNLLMGASAAGNAKNQALLSGAELWKANLYGALNGLSETGLGTVLGNIPGLNNNTKFAMKEILSEGTEEFLQEYVDAGLRAGILGEKIDLDSLSNDAWKSFLYGAATSGIMTGGQTTINLGLHGISYVLNTSNLLNSSVSDGQIIDINSFRNNVSNVADNQSQSINSNPQIINFNEAVQNRGNTVTENASPKKEYTPPKVEIRDVQLEEDIANNASIDNNVSQAMTASELVASISNPIDSREALDIIAKAYYNPEFKDYSNHRKVVSAINNGHKKALPSVEAVNKFYQRFLNKNIFRRTKYALSTPQDDYFLHAWSFGFDKDNVSQRLYLNGEIEDTLRFIELFADKCEKKKIPLYFKTGLFKVENNKVECNDLSLTRDDSVVIYANEKYLLDYIFICNEIFSQNPDLKFYSPPILTGKVSKYVGIGAEIDNGNSYNGVRGDVIAYAFERLELHFINKYGDTVKTANGKLDFNKIKTNKELYEEFLNKLNLYIKNEGIKNGVNENFCGYNKLVINQYAGFKKPNYSNVEWTLDKFATEMEKHDELFGSDSSMLMLYDYLTGLSNIGDFSIIDNLRYVLTSIDRNTLQNYYNTIVQAFNEEVNSSKQLRYIGAKPTHSSNKNYTHDDFVKAMNDYDLQHGKNSSIYLLYKYLKGNIKTDKFDEKSSLLDIVKNIDKNTLIDYYNDVYKVYANRKTKDKVTRINNINHSIANIIDVSTLNMENVGGMFEKGASTVNLNQSYKGFDYVVRPNASLDTTIAEIINNNDGSNILVEITNANELTEELVSNLPDNVSIRISNYNNNYYNTFNNANASSNGTLRHLTYSALELREIMDKIKTIEGGIDSSWNDYQKAQYIYEYLRDNVTYHSRDDMHSILPFEQQGNANRPKHYDGLMSLVDGVSTCQGFAHTYKILLDRLGIECTEVWGQLDGEGQHAYNVVTINDNTFIVDTTRESLERNSPAKYEGTGFGVQNISQYNAKSDRSILNTINMVNVDGALYKISDLNNTEHIQKQYDDFDITKGIITIGFLLNSLKDSNFVDTMMNESLKSLYGKYNIERYLYEIKHLVEASKKNNIDLELDEKDSKILDMLYNKSKSVVEFERKKFELINDNSNDESRNISGYYLFAAISDDSLFDSLNSSTLDTKIGNYTVEDYLQGIVQFVHEIKKESITLGLSQSENNNLNALYEKALEELGPSKIPFNEYLDDETKLKILFSQNLITDLSEDDILLLRDYYDKKINPSISNIKNNPFILFTDEFQYLYGELTYLCSTEKYKDDSKLSDWLKGINFIMGVGYDYLRTDIIKKSGVELKDYLNKILNGSANEYGVDESTYYGFKRFIMFNTFSNGKISEMLDIISTEEINQLFSIPVVEDVFQTALQMVNLLSRVGNTNIDTFNKFINSDIVIQNIKNKVNNLLLEQNGINQIIGIHNIIKKYSPDNKLLDNIKELFNSEEFKNSQQYIDNRSILMGYGTLEFDTNLVTSVINDCRNSDVRFSDEFLSNAITKFLVPNKQIIDKFRNDIDGFTKEDTELLIDCMSLLEIMDGSIFDLAFDYLNISIDEYNLMFDYINKCLLENNSLIDIEHYQSHIYNFAKYYCKINGIDMNVKLYNEESSTGGDHSDGMIRFNTKYFTNDYKTDNHFLDNLGTIFHEVFHEFQSLENKAVNKTYGPYQQNVFNKHTLTYAIEMLIWDKIGYDQYYQYTYKKKGTSKEHSNYWNNQFEVDARFGSYVLLSNYIKQISPKTYEETQLYDRTNGVKNRKAEYYFLNRLHENSVLYDINENAAMYEGVLLNRDIILDKLIMKDPSLIQQNPILYYIYNLNGTRKTTVEIKNYIKNNALDQSTIEMLNYWMRISKFSLEGLIREVCTVYKNPSYNYYDLKNKITETMLQESNYCQDKDFILKVNTIIDSYIDNGYLNEKEANDIKKQLEKYYSNIFVFEKGMPYKKEVSGLRELATKIQGYFNGNNNSNVIRTKNVNSNNTNNQSNSNLDNSLMSESVIDSSKTNVNIDEIIEDFRNIPPENINDVIEESNLSEEQRIELLKKLPNDVIANYIVKTIEDSRTYNNEKLLAYKDSLKMINVFSLITNNENIEIIKSKVNDAEYVSNLAKICIEAGQNQLYEVDYFKLLKIPELTPLLCQKTSYFNSVLQSLFDIYDFETIYSNILSHIDSSKMHEYIYANTIHNLSEENKVKLEKQCPGIIDKVYNSIDLSAKDILRYGENNPLFNAFLDYDNNKYLFGNKSYDEYIEMFYNYLMSSEYDKSKLLQYLRIDSLREKLLKVDKIVEYLNKTSFNNSSDLMYLFENEDLYNKIDKNSQLYSEYVKAVISGKTQLIPTRITDIINIYRKDNGEKSDSFKTQLLNVLESKRKVLDKFRSDQASLTMSDYHDIIDFLSIDEIINTRDSLFEKLSLGDKLTTEEYELLKEYNNIYDYINKTLLENNFAIDLSHYQSHIYNFTKYYCRLNNLNDIEVDFYYEDDTIAGNHSTGSIGFNTKYFTKKFKTDNIFLDKLVTIFHESFHEIQEIECENITLFGPQDKNSITKYNLTYSIEQLLRDLIPEYYNFAPENSTRKNYDYIIFETDARYNASLLVSNYIKKIAPDVYKEVSPYLDKVINDDKFLYNLNNNLGEYNGLLLNRDMILDKLIRENVTLLKNYPILNYIYNQNGTRKTTKEIKEFAYNEYVINESFGKNTLDMLYYWMRVSKFSLESLIREISSLHGDEVYIDIEAKAIETMLLESNGFTDPDFIDKMNSIIDLCVDNCDLNIDKANGLKEVMKNKYNKYKSIYDSASFDKNNIDSSIIIEVVRRNIDNVDYIRKLISQCDYETYRSLVNSSISKEKIVPYLCERKEFFSKLIDKNLDDNFDLFNELVLSHVDVNKLYEYISFDLLSRLSPEVRNKLDEKYPGIIKKVIEEHVHKKFGKE